MVSKLLQALITSLFILDLSVGQAQFTSALDLPIEGALSQCAFDVDGDGAMDIVVSGRSGIQVILGVDGDLSLDDSYLVDPFEMFVAMADLDGDGLEDLVASNDDPGGIRWYRNTGFGTFDTAVLLIPGLKARQMVAADMDDDDDIDLAFVTHTGVVMWSENTDGLGAMAAPTLLLPTSVASEIQVVELNGDRFPDILFGHALFGSLSYAINAGDGTMGEPVAFSAGNSGRAGDINSDGLPDVVSVSYVDGTIQWYEHLGTTAGVPAFGPAQPIATGIGEPGLLKLADIDLDGTVDIALVEGSPERILWFSNLTGLGSFGTPQVVGSDVIGNRFLELVDIDADGDLEVFTASAVEPRWVWHRNLSMAEFMITGRVFHDQNDDGIFNGDDHGLADQMVRISEDAFTFTNASGFFYFPVEPGTFTITHSAGDAWQLVNGPGVYQRTLSIVENHSHGNDFAYVPAAPTPGLLPDITTGIQRCAFQVPYWLTVRNSGNMVGDVQLRLYLNDMSTFVSAEPEPELVDGNVLVFNMPQVQPTHSRSVRLDITMPDVESIGNLLVDSMHATLHGGDDLLTEASVANQGELTCAYDPNDKLVHPVGEGEEALVPMGQELTWTIRFQNTGNDTAFTVLLSDFISTEMDLTTLRIIANSHHMVSRMDGNGELEFLFPHILLPDSNVNEPASHGFVRFAMRPKSGMAEGTVVENEADIYFDYNPAILTNMVHSTFSNGVQSVSGVSKTPGSLRVYPNPFSDLLNVRLDDMAGRVELMLLSASGQVVWDRVVHGGGLVTIGRNSLPAGAYVLRAMPLDGDGDIHMVKVFID